MDCSNLYQYPWYFGKINRQDAESQLTDLGENEGCFLVRESQTKPGHWSLSVLDWSNGQCEVCHYLLEKDWEGKFYLEEDIKFGTIAELIEFYKENPSVSFRLKEPCPKALKIPDKEDGYDMYEVVTELFGEKFTRESLIYSGTMSKVWKGSLKSTSKKLFVAKIPTDHPDSVHILTHEANVLKCLKHENVVRFWGILSTSVPLHLITEFAGDTNLIDFLLSIDSTKISILEQLSIVLQVASALKFCERMRCVHRNIKAKSIILDSKDLKCRLGSFQHSRTIDEFGYYHAVSTEDKLEIMRDSRLRWMSPEAAVQGRFSISSDVWSFGILLVEIFTNGGLPYPGHLTCNIIKEIEKGFRCQKPPTCPDSIYDIMVKCWMPSEVTRPTFAVIKDFFEDYIKNNNELLVKFSPAKSRHLSRYVPIHTGIKQARTTRRKNPPSPGVNSSNRY